MILKNMDPEKKDDVVTLIVWLVFGLAFAALGVYFISHSQDGTAFLVGGSVYLGFGIFFIFDKFIL